MTLDVPKNVVDETGSASARLDWATPPAASPPVEGTIVAGTQGGAEPQLNATTTEENQPDRGEKFREPRLSLVLGSQGTPIVVPRSEPFILKDVLLPLESWEGVVEHVDPDGGWFSARLLSESGPEEIAEFDLVEVSRGDRDLVQQDAIFYWTIGYRETLAGQRSRESVIRFRRLPVWSERELEEARQEALERLKRFRVE